MWWKKNPPLPGKPDIRPVRTFYPEATTLEAALPVQVGPGQEVTGINIRLQTAATYHVRGKIAGALPDDDDERLRIMLTPRTDDSGSTWFFFGGRSNVKKDLTFDADGVAPGPYNLVLTSFGSHRQSLGMQPVDVGAGDVNDVVFNIVPPGELRGLIRIEGTPPANAAQPNLSSVRLSLTTTGFGRYARATAKADGTFILEDVGPAKYDFHVSPVPNGTYLKSVLLGGQDVLGRELDFTQGASGRLEIVFRYGAAEVDGTVQNASTTGNSNAQPTSPATALVALIPDTLRPDGSGIYSGNIDQNGSFAIRQVAPGHYRAYAFARADLDSLGNPELLKGIENLGTDLEVKENDHKQIQLPLIPAGDFRQILARLGMDEQ